MRIDLYTSAAINPAAETAASSVGFKGQQPSSVQTSAVQPVESDRTTLSSDSLSVRSLSAQALASADQRDTYVESLKQQVSSGDYVIQPDAIAQSILRDRA